MSTNYYLQKDAAAETSLHIGKSSAGWRFALRVDPAKGIHDLPDWLRRFDEPGATIHNSRGEVIPSAEMINLIANRPDYNGQPLRSHVPNMRRARAGAGTWDCCEDEVA